MLVAWYARAAASRNLLNLTAPDSIALPDSPRQARDWQAQWASGEPNPSYPSAKQVTYGSVFAIFTARGDTPLRYP
jgi:hypothetical protein